MPVKKSPMERMNEASENTEIWWDSSPLIFESWKHERIKSKPLEKRDEEEELLDRYYISGRPMEQLFRGVTTNPPLSGAVIKDDPGFWREMSIEIKRRNPAFSSHQVWWEVYKQVVKRGAEKYLGVFRGSSYKYGFISGQVDPRDYENEEAMKKQALDLASLASNVMIKIPGTEQGIRVIKYLTSKGIATNCTLAFVLPQFVAAGHAVAEGVEQAKKNGVDLSMWRSVITSMTARYEALGDFDSESEKIGVELTEADIRWAGIGIFTKAMRYLEEKGLPSKMLICSMRKGPIVDGKVRLWHFEKLSGSNAVFTCPPKYIDMVDELGEDIEFDPDGWKEPIPPEVMEKLNKFKYFREAYDPEGLAPPEFNRHTALIATAKSFSDATNEMERFVEESVNNAEIKYRPKVDV
ncbi:MAG TPA: transaldolase family protein [Spirochaetia bacterium]|nr:transaldolase family protein [Spirochaetia bacterium]